MQQEVGRYRCLGTSGQEYLVIELQNMVPFTGIDGGRQYRPGTKELRLADGTGVNFIDENTFQIFDTGEILRKL